MIYATGRGGNEKEMAVVDFMNMQAFSHHVLQRRALFFLILNI